MEASTSGVKNFLPERNNSLTSALAGGFYDIPFSGKHFRSSASVDDLQDGDPKHATLPECPIKSLTGMKSRRYENVVAKFRKHLEKTDKEMDAPPLAKTSRALSEAKAEIAQQKEAIERLKTMVRKLEKKTSSMSIFNGDWSSDGEREEPIPPQAPMQVEENSFEDGVQNEETINATQEPRAFSSKPSLEEIRSLQSIVTLDHPQNLVLATVAQVGELSELFQWRGEVEEGLPDWSDCEKERLSQGLSDILLYLIRLSEKCCIDLPAAVVKKIALNERKYPVSQVKGSSKKYTEYSSKPVSGESESTQSEAGKSNS